VAPLRVVVVFDVGADRVVRFGSRFESAAVHELLLQSSEEALGDGVVVAVARGAQAYQRLLTTTKPNLARLIIARRLAAAVLAMWKHGEDYEPTKHGGTAKTM